MKYTEYSEYVDEWKDLEENEDYQINKFGTIKNKINGRLSFGSIKVDGYLYHRLIKYKDGKKILKDYKTHTLVAKYFIPNPESKVFVKHKDGDITNPIYTNLEWGDKIKKVNISKGGYPVCEYDIDGNLIRVWKSCGMVALIYPISRIAIYNACKEEGVTAYGRQWKLLRDTDGAKIEKLTIENWRKYNIKKKSFNYNVGIPSKCLYKK